MKQHYPLTGYFLSTNHVFFFTLGDKSIMLLPIFNELGRIDLSLAFVLQRRISVFALFNLSLFADIHKLMSSVDVEMLSRNESI